MNIRRNVYFLLDTLKGGNIKKQLDEIIKANSDDNYATRLQEEALADLIKHAVSTVPFYRGKNLKGINSFPIVNKVMMKDNMEMFKSNANLNITKKRHTSGSTGIPFEILQDERKDQRVQAEFIYYRELTGDKLGEKFVNLTTPRRIYKESKIDTFKKNMINFDVTHMTPDTMDALYRLLSKDKSVGYMLGYASALERIAKYFEEKGYINQFHLKAIVTCSEIMTTATMEHLSRVFNCKIYDRYSNEDNGFLSQTDGLNYDFIINRASYYIEILKMDSDEPARENELGRIVVTDLFNYAQPFIRYDTGDLGAVSTKKIGNNIKQVFTKVAGRISDVLYDINNNPVNTFAVAEILECFDKIKQYQLVQNDRNSFTLNLCDPMKFYKDEEYIKVLMELFGEECEYKINYVNSIAVLSSGKFRKVVCNYKPEKENVN